jgi:hypothetical protein
MVEALRYKPEVAGSTPDGVIDPAWRTMAPGFTQHVTEISTGIFLGVKCCRRVRLAAKPPSVCRLSGQRGIFDISQPQRFPLPVEG